MSILTAEELLSHYHHFARSPLLTDSDIEQDFYRLVSNQRVTSVGFVDDGTVLMVGIDDVVIEYQEAFYVIGQFYIFIVREQDEKGYWQCTFRFWNHTKPLVFTCDIVGDDGQNTRIETLCPHPHMYVADDCLLPFPNAELCISKGYIPVLHDIQRGSIAQAIIALIEILEIYPTGTAYKKVELWAGEPPIILSCVNDGGC